MIRPECIIHFLEDENLVPPIETKNIDSDLWTISFNEPFIEDSKRRCGILQRLSERTGRLEILFNSFKSVATYGDEYRGSLWQFVKLIKGFVSREEAKYYFLKNYVLKYGGELSEFLSEECYENKQDSGQVCGVLDFPETAERLISTNGSRREYIEYLASRGVDINNPLLKQVKIFIDDKTKRILFPTYEGNELVFYTGRCIKDNPIPWLKSKGRGIYPIWNLENINGETVNVFEGIFDALLVPNGVAVLGATYIGKEIINKLLDKGFSRINVIMDNDAAGFMARTKLAEGLSEYHNNVWIYNFSGIVQKDFSQMKQENVPFDMDKRLMQWNFYAKIALKMGGVK